jgi:hypothetical protein
LECIFVITSVKVDGATTTINPWPTMERFHFQFCRAPSTMAAATCQQNARSGLHPKLVAPVSPCGDPLASTSSFSSTNRIAVDGVQPHLGLQLEAHRRWNASLPALGYLWSVDRVEINVTRTDADGALVFVLEVFLSLPASRLPLSRPSSSNEELTAAATSTFKVERPFSDFRELRSDVSACVSMERQCTCQYCLKFVEHIRFSGSQPRGLVMRFGGEEKRKQLLQRFVNDFVALAQRRVPKRGNGKCQAQQLVPAVLSAFLLHGAGY